MTERLHLHLVPPADAARDEPRPPLGLVAPADVPAPGELPSPPPAEVDDAAVLRAQIERVEAAEIALHALRDFLVARGLCSGDRLARVDGDLARFRESIVGARTRLAAIEKVAS